jgi:hypothetical protein
MNTGEVKLHKNDLDKTNHYVIKENSLWPAIVYHGAIIYEKGIEYFVKLAQELKHIICLIPENKSVVENYLDINIENENIIFDRCTWETGLKEYVINAKLTICPSLWSAPIEGALIKSIAYSPMTAAVKTKYGFINDIPNDVILKLDLDPIIGSRTVLKYLNEVSNIKSKKAENYLNNYLYSGDSKMNLLFE